MTMEACGTRIYRDWAGLSRTVVAVRSPNFNPTLTPAKIPCVSTLRPNRPSRGGSDVDVVFLLIIAALYAVTHWIVWAITRLEEKP